MMARMGATAEARRVVATAVVSGRRRPPASLLLPFLLLPAEQHEAALIARCIAVACMTERGERGGITMYGRASVYTTIARVALLMRSWTL